jgi:hypothetical protein
LPGFTLVREKIDKQADLISPNVEIISSAKPIVRGLVYENFWLNFIISA